MSVKVEHNHPDFPKGYEFDVGGVGVPNGGSVELSEDQEKVFLANRGFKFKDGNWGPYVKVTGSAELSKATVEELATPVEDLQEEKGGEN